MPGAEWDEVTPRESAVLAAVERRLTNAEIAAEFYISVRTVESHIAALRRKLGADSRSKLITAARERRATAIHVPRNSFVGRGNDVDAVRALLDGARWVTVVGAAGCGKTRLALELAATDARVPVVADLEHVAPDEVAAAVAGAIGLTGTADLAACAVALEGRPHLLVIDNCDRVSDSVGDVVSHLLVLAGSLTVLATSRSPIGASDETVYQLAPLPVDDTGATRLFLDRAGSAAPTTVLTDADTSLVVGICERLDGLPLAIELAAARVRHLPVAELAARLEDGFGPLDRAAPASRHRTLETAFDWTWDLLDDDEKSVLSALAGLPRTFDLELAEAVTAPGSDGVVLRLLDRSLVSATVPDTDPRRFRLLGSLRSFVLDRTAFGDGRPRPSHTRRVPRRTGNGSGGTGSHRRQPGHRRAGQAAGSRSECRHRMGDRRAARADPSARPRPCRAGRAVRPGRRQPGRDRAGRTRPARPARDDRNGPARYRDRLVLWRS